MTRLSASATSSDGAFFIVTPCKGVCNYCPKTDKCLTCKRSLEQITNWRSYTPIERREIMRVLKEQDH